MNPVFPKFPNEINGSPASGRLGGGGSNPLAPTIYPSESLVAREPLPEVSAFFARGRPVTTIRGTVVVGTEGVVRPLLTGLEVATWHNPASEATRSCVRRSSTRQSRPCS